MNDTNLNGAAQPVDALPVDKCGDLITVTCDEFVEFIEEESQPASAWPWPEPPFVRESDSPVK